MTILRNPAAVFVFLAAGLFSGLASAHPHAWIDLQVRVIFDDQGRVVALHQTWLFDPISSALALENLRAMDNGLSMAARVDQYGATILANSANQHYLTRITHNGQPVALGEVTEYSIQLIDQRLQFQFVLPLAEPLELGAAPLKYKIYDPTYYIQVVHIVDNGSVSPAALTLVNAPQRCRTKIIMPNPDPAKVLKAAMLDRTEAAPEGLGRFFAETGVVSCAR